MSSSMYKIFILLVFFFHIIKGLDICEDKSTDCQPCNFQYPVPLPTRGNCMKTCQVCTNRNVALRQTTSQSSMAYSGESKRAVDGNTNGVYWAGSSCTFTAETSGTHWWCVDLKTIYNIKNITMYNRVDSDGGRLMGFELKTSSSGQCNEAGFTTSSLCYKNDPPTNQKVYTIDRCNQDSNKSIVAGTLFVSVTGEVLNICEVQAFTGISCSYGYHSTPSSTCEPCNDGCSDNKCNPDTGDCIGVCKSGFYGTKCQQKCSEGCENKECTKLDGSCSCINGWYGPRCQMQCNTGCKGNVCDQNGGRCSECRIPGQYGDHCEDTCSQGCSTPDCERDGTCSCKDGFKGSYCQTPCDVNCRICDVVSCTVCKPGWYGDNCESRCPTECKETCNKTSGTCDECKEGTVGLYCDIKCGEECRTMTEEEKRWSICKGDCSRICQHKYYGESSEVIISRCNYVCIGGRKSETCLRVEEISVQEKNYKYPISPVTASSISGIVGLIFGGAVTGLICWLCCIRRRQPGDQQDTRTDQRRHNNSISTNQPSTIIQNETFLSDQQTNTYDTLDHTDAQNDTYSNAYVNTK